jgi:TolB-like protein/class 3 adenylate cyclase/Flp pilus assembly protein TadD
MPAERRLASILFTDIVGYTALMAESEEEGLRARERHRELVRPLVVEHRGESIEARGDESLSVFPTALDAVSCALAIEERLRNEPGLALHMGIHLGDVIVDAGEVSGDGVNIASRICALSQDGGICVSSEVYQSIRNQPNIEAVPLGAQELKNVGRPVDVWALGRPGLVSVSVARPRRRLAPVFSAIAAALLLLLAGLGWWAWEPARAPAGPIRSIAVLPLDNLSGDPEQEYFADGMTEALIANLAQLGSLRVISRTTVMQYKGTRSSLPEIAEELSVDALVEGSVFRDGDRVRVTAQLIDARRDEHLWAQQFDRDMQDLLGLQKEIASHVAQRVQARMTPRAADRLEQRPAVIPEAHEEYTKGLYFAQKHTPRAAMRARGHFEKSMSIDPEYPLGYAGMADMLSCSPMHTWVVAAEGEDVAPTAVMDLAQELASRAIELDPDLPEAQTALGLVHVFRGWNWDEAMFSLDSAVELNPSYEFSRRARALTLASLGRLEEAQRDIDVALEVDPLNAMVAHTAGDIHRWRGEIERAVELYREAIELDAGNPHGRQSLGLWMCRSGEVDEGGALLQQARTTSHHDPLVVGDLGYCLGAAGRADEARGLLASLEQRSTTEWVSPVGVARIQIGLGDHEGALTSLEHAYHERAYRLVELGLDDRWDPIRDDPRFRDLVRRVGIVEPGRLDG